MYVFCSVICKKYHTKMYDVYLGEQCRYLVPLIEKYWEYRNIYVQSSTDDIEMPNDNLYIVITNNRFFITNYLTTKDIGYIGDEKQGITNHVPGVSTPILESVSIVSNIRTLFMSDKELRNMKYFMLEEDSSNRKIVEGLCYSLAGLHEDKDILYVCYRVKNQEQYDNVVNSFRQQRHTKKKLTIHQMAKNVKFEVCDDIITNTDAPMYKKPDLNVLLSARFHYHPHLGAILAHNCENYIIIDRCLAADMKNYMVGENGWVNERESRRHTPMVVCLIHDTEPGVYLEDLWYLYIQRKPVGISNQIHDPFIIDRVRDIVESNDINFNMTYIKKCNAENTKASNNSMVLGFMVVGVLSVLGGIALNEKH